VDVAEVWTHNQLPLPGGVAQPGSDANHLAVAHPVDDPADVLARPVHHLQRRGWRLADRDPSGHRATLDIGGTDLLAVECARRAADVWVELTFVT
jgi:hypothetical protein